MTIFRFLLVSLLSAISASALTTVGDLRCENRMNPPGIDSLKPRFGWVSQSGERAEHQTAYQVLASSSPQLLGRDQGDCWDSGKVSSDNSVNVVYAGKPLISGQQCFWKVRVWDKAGHPSAWSQSAMWTMGLMHPQDWTAKWIGTDENGSNAINYVFQNAQWIWTPEGNPAQQAPVGVRQFQHSVIVPADRKLVRASCLMTADNRFELFVNGKSAGSGNNFKHPARLDVTGLFQTGSNQLSVTAVNEGDSPNPAGLIAMFKLEFTTGEPLVVITDDHWQASMDGQIWTPAKSLGSFGIAPWEQLTDNDDWRLPARYLRREFSIEKKVARATTYVCGLGFFELYLNGKRVSDHLMDPALSDYRKAAYYLTFDVTDQIKRGSNALGVVLGNGRFYGPRSVGNYGYPKLLLQTEIQYADGTIERICSDENWKLTTDGPIRANNEYDGEEYDARMEMPGWDRAGFDALKWQPARVVAPPGGGLVSQMIEPMRVTQILKPVAITNPKPGIFEVDFGQNFYGAVRLKAKGSRGTTVRMVGAYSLLPDGTLKTADNRGALCTDVYTFKGQGTEVWSPRFKGQGFRRVQVTGFPGTPIVDNFEGLVIHTDVEPAGEFQCSNELVNRIHTAMRWGMRMFLRSAPLDPDRDERQAWMGDPAKDAESEAFNFNVAPFYTKWMDDVRRSQRADGAIPDVAMYWNGGDSVEWPSVFTIIPEWMADFYADRRVAETNYVAMKKWVLAMRRHELPDGTLKGTSYGDWCDTYTMDEKVSDKGATPFELVCTAYQYNNCRIVERLAGRLGETADQRQFGEMADKLKTAFNQKFLDPKTHVYQGGTQCGYVLALQFGLVPVEQREAVITNLVGDIMVQHQGHLSVGLIGMQWLMQTLTDIGRPDVAWTIATQTNRPSWGYMLSKGATTIWERWDCDTRDPGMNSEALLIQAGNLDAWFYQTLAGINYDPAQPGFKHIIIKPAVVGNLTWVKAHFDSPYGRIVSHWKRDAGKMTMNVMIPPNTTATVYFPGTSDAAVTEGGQPLDKVAGVKFLRMENGRAIFEIGSGQYEFVGKLNN